ncbi:MAG: DUF1552 domain-containing protein [Phycisphaerales bacterium]
MTRRTPLSRRTVLRGLGVSLALPWLDAMATGSAAASALGGRAAGAPLRLAFVFAPNGVHYDSWAPTRTADGVRFSEALAPLERVRDRVNILTGLTLDKARPNGDGPGDHARSSASFLTGMQARKTAGNDIRIGVSVDQLAAAQIGRRTRLPSIELGCEPGRRAGNCDSGYSCAYSSNISWRDEDTPVPKIVDPAAAFDRLFGDGVGLHAADRARRRRSVLDFVADEARSLERALGVVDRRRLDEFQTAVRDIEQRVERTLSEDIAPPIGTQEPEGIPERISEHIDLMYDMLVLAFQTDTTRIASYMLGTGGSNRIFPEIGINEGHHHLSHHRGEAGMIEKIRLIDRFYTERFARFVERLGAIPEGEGTLLDNCLILHGSGISDGNRHNHEDLPVVMAGRGGGRVSTGRLIEHERDTPLSGLYIDLLRRAGCDVDRFGDAVAPVTSLG